MYSKIFTYNYEEVINKPIMPITWIDNFSPWHLSPAINKLNDGSFRTHVLFGHVDMVTAGTVHRYGLQRKDSCMILECSLLIEQWWLYQLMAPIYDFIVPHTHLLVLQKLFNNNAVRKIIEKK